MKERSNMPYLLALLGFIGIAGIHRFHLGFKGTGLLWLCTFGFFGFGTFLDLLTMESLISKAERRDHVSYLLEKQRRGE